LTGKVVLFGTLVLVSSGDCRDSNLNLAITTPSKSLPIYKSSCNNCPILFDSVACNFFK